MPEFDGINKGDFVLVEHTPRKLPSDSRIAGALQMFVNAGYIEFAGRDEGSGKWYIKMPEMFGLLYTTGEVVAFLDGISAGTVMTGMASEK